MKHLKYFNESQSGQMENDEQVYTITSLGPLERIAEIPENVNIFDYIKSQLFQKDGEYYYENDYGELRKIKFSFEDNDILVYPDGKYKLLLNEVLKPGSLFFDIRYPNKIEQLSDYTKPDCDVPFGYRQRQSYSNGKTYVVGNDAFIPVKKLG